MLITSERAQERSGVFFAAAGDLRVNDEFGVSGCCACCVL